MDLLAVIPARAGSKGISKKNTKLLAGKPLVQYTIEVAKEVFKTEDILISTDDDHVVGIAENLGVPVPFKRPEYLSNDTASMYNVLLHALEKHEERVKRNVSGLVLLQPTSPFRTSLHVKEAIQIFEDNKGLDMVVSVNKAKSNPYYTLFEENKKGYLKPSKKGDFVRRQDCPDVWEYNGAVYVININSLKKYALNKFERIKKYEMSDETSLDLDTPLDWKIAEELIKII
ncbi:acylneuraminate cytidylyltransferase family protein [Flagellimonas sp. 2504JD1-5]